MTMQVPDHYGSAEIVERILAAIPWSPAAGIPLMASQLFPYDQLHGRELLATKDHAARLGPDNNAHLLDVGAGIGGPARYLAGVFGCSVTGIDLTPEFVAAANALCEFCDLAGQVNIVEGDAAKMPFDANAFDNAYSFYVGMNIPDKRAVLDECFRVIKPGGTLLWTEVTAVTEQPHYPLPWSRTAEGSHLITVESLMSHFTAAGFDTVAVEDETDAHLELARVMRESGKIPTEEHIQVNEVVLGADFAEHRKNYIRSLSDGLIRSSLFLMRKPA